ncbi:cytochrome P450 2D14-like [Neosynchiropus ocellatus]
MIETAALLFLSLLLLLTVFRTKRPQNFPPGPPPIPILGNLLHLNLESPIEDFETFARKYGNVFSIFIGSRPTVVLNGLKAIKEALVTKAADFSGRPQDQMVNHAATVYAHAPGVILADYGPLWREQRRFGLMALRNFGLGKHSMERRILEEIQHVTELLEQNIGKPTCPHMLFHNAAFNIISRVLFARHFDHEDESMKFNVNVFRETSKIINGRWGLIYDSLPLLRFLPLPFRKAFTLFKESYVRRRQIVAECKESRVPGQPRHFIDCYLDELDKRGNGESSFSEDQLHAYILDLHFAGTDTTANTLLFALLYLIHYPHVQERCQREIDEVLGDKAEASFEDRHQMPYFQAVYHEVQRVANVAPFAVFHQTTKDTELMGYSIPKGTMVIPNLSSLLFEGGQWKDQHSFNPENFLNHEGEFFKPEAFMPFSTGPRMCLGEGLARMELFLFLVTLLRKFTFIWPENAGKPDFSPVYGATQTTKPYQMVVQYRRS